MRRLVVVICLCLLIGNAYSEEASTGSAETPSKGTPERERSGRTFKPYLYYDDVFRPEHMSPFYRDTLGNYAFAFPQAKYYMDRDEMRSIDHPYLPQSIRLFRDGRRGFVLYLPRNHNHQDHPELNNPHSTVNFPLYSREIQSLASNTIPADYKPSYANIPMNVPWDDAIQRAQVAHRELVDQIRSDVRVGTELERARWQARREKVRDFLQERIFGWSQLRQLEREYTYGQNRFGNFFPEELNNFYHRQQQEDVYFRNREHRPWEEKSEELRRDLEQKFQNADDEQYFGRWERRSRDMAGMPISERLARTEEERTREWLYWNRNRPEQHEEHPSKWTEPQKEKHSLVQSSANPEQPSPVSETAPTTDSVPVPMAATVTPTPDITPTKETNEDTSPTTPTIVATVPASMSENSSPTTTEPAPMAENSPITMENANTLDSNLDAAATVLVEELSSKLPKTSAIAQVQQLKSAVATLNAKLNRLSSVLQAPERSANAPSRKKKKKKN